MRVSLVGVLLVACSLAAVAGMPIRSPTREDAAVTAGSSRPSAPSSLPLPSLSSLPAHVHSELGRPGKFAQLSHPLAPIARAAQASLNCSVCEGVVALLIPMLQTPAAQADMIGIATIACEAIKPLCVGEEACDEVCTGLVSEYTPEFFTLLNELLLNPLDVCVALHQCPAPPTPAPSTAIPVASNLKNLDGEIEWPSWGITQGVGTFVHLSDAHLDPTYTPGASSACGLPVCCHTFNGPGPSENTTAGFFGSYSCDTPPQLAQSLLDFLSTLEPLPDFILYTGDDPAHDVWKQSRAENLNAIQLWTSMINETLGVSIPVFATLGNHEVYPINQFAGPGFDDWLYDACVDMWAPFLPADAQATMSYGGYYQARIRPGLRVISLNSNYLTNDNFWLLANHTFAQDQLNWMADVLAQTSALGEKAIIICHAPLATWNNGLANAYRVIATKYASTILNLFMGHTHENSIQTLHALESVSGGTQGAPQHVAWVGGSIVPFTNINPGFMLYEYDRAAVATGTAGPTLVTQAASYWLDLPAANAANSTEGLWSTASPNWNATADMGVAVLDAPSIAAAASAQLASNATTAYASFVRAMSKGVLPRSGWPSAHAVSCKILSDTAADAHTCAHGAGLTEQQIRDTEAEEASRC